MPETERLADVARAAAAPALMLGGIVAGVSAMQSFGWPFPPKAILVPMMSVPCIALLIQVGRGFRIAYVHGCYRVGRLARLFRL